MRCAQERRLRENERHTDHVGVSCRDGRGSRHSSVDLRGRPAVGDADPVGFPGCRTPGRRGRDGRGWSGAGAIPLPRPQVTTPRVPARRASEGRSRRRQRARVSAGSRLQIHESQRTRAQLGLRRSQVLPATPRKILARVTSILPWRAGLRQNMSEPKENRGAQGDTPPTTSEVIPLPAVTVRGRSTYRARAWQGQHRHSRRGGAEMAGTSGRTASGKRGRQAVRSNIADHARVRDDGRRGGFWDRNTAVYPARQGPEAARSGRPAGTP